MWRSELALIKQSHGTLTTSMGHRYQDQAHKMLLLLLTLCHMAPVRLKTLPETERVARKGIRWRENSMVSAASTQGAGQKGLCRTGTLGPK